MEDTTSDSDVQPTSPPNPFVAKKSALSLSKLEQQNPGASTQNWVAFKPSWKTYFFGLLATFIALNIYANIQFDQSFLANCFRLFLALFSGTMLIFGVVILKNQNKVAVNLTENKIRIKKQTFDLSEVDGLILDIAGSFIGQQIKFKISAGKIASSITVTMPFSNDVLSSDRIRVFIAAVQQFNLPDDNPKTKFSLWAFLGTLSTESSLYHVNVGKLEATRTLTKLITPRDSEKVGKHSLHGR